MDNQESSSDDKESGKKTVRGTVVKVTVKEGESWNKSGVGERTIEERKIMIQRERKGGQ